MKKLEDFTNDELAKMWHDAYDRKAAQERAWKDRDGVLVNAIEALLTKRLHDSGSLSFATLHGTIHTVGRTTAKIMDPAEVWSWVMQDPADRRPALDLKVNVTFCKKYMDTEKTEVPGVQLNTYRYLSITSPKEKPNVE